MVTDYQVQVVLLILSLCVWLLIPWFMVAASLVQVWLFIPHAMVQVWLKTLKTFVLFLDLK
jgi:hypothetical protein